MKTILCACIALSLAGVAQAQQTSTEPTSQADSSQPSSAKNWLLGRWEFDQAYTEAEQAADQARNAAVSEDAAAVIESQLLDKMKGATLVVTDTQVTMTRGDGTGKTQRYVRIENPDPNTIQLRQENGEVLTFRRDGERIRTTTTGSVKEPFFFKRSQ